MTDVRLTALNPVDSQVYPVACNTSGELLVAQDSDPDLTVTGDLTVNGSSTFDSASSFVTDITINSIKVGRGAGNVNGNSAFGYQTLNSNISGGDNTANGYQALINSTTGNSNTAIGMRALRSNTTGNNNTAAGRNALSSNTTGYNNVGIGYNGLFNNTTGSGNIGIGFLNNAGGYAPVFNPTTESNRLVLGHTSITNAYVKVSWTVTSDERDKMNFTPVPYGLDFVNQLKPTSYKFKIDRNTESSEGGVRYGFKAQDILALEGGNPVIIDNEDLNHLKYNPEYLIPVLVNAIKELSNTVNDLKEKLTT